MSKIIYVDVETTGLNEAHSHIYQIAGIVEVDGKHKEEFSFSMAVPSTSFIHEVCMKHFEDKGLDLSLLVNNPASSEAFKKVLDILDKYVDKFNIKDKFHICAYNAHFDTKFIRAWFHQNENDFYGSYFWPDNLDVMVLASFVLKPIRYKLENFQLKNLCKIFDIPINAHDALSDIRATRNLFFALENHLNNEKD